MYKRAKDFLSELNSVPMLGKRSPAVDDDTTIDEEWSDMDATWAAEGGNIMDDVSLVGRPPPLSICLSFSPLFLY